MTKKTVNLDRITARRIRQDLKFGWSYLEICERYRVCTATVTAISRGAEASPRRRGLGKAGILKARKLRAQGRTLLQIAKELGVAGSYIHKITSNDQD